MEIGGLQKTTLIDYPGKVACTVFLIGCNFRCPFCYSSELVLPEKIELQPRVSEEDFFNFLKERKGLLEGVTICGGEPCVNKDLPTFCGKIKKLGYWVKLDTNGSNPAMLKGLIEKNLIDYVAMDIKAPIEKYGFYSGEKADIGDIQESIKILKEGKCDYEFRTTVAPGLKKEDILKIADWIGGKNIKYFLQEFNSQKEILNPEILSLPLLEKEEIEKIVKEIESGFQNCQLR